MSRNNSASICTNTSSSEDGASTLLHTVCPRSLYPFYDINNINWAKTSWIYSAPAGVYCWVHTVFCAGRERGSDHGEDRATGGHGNRHPQLPQRVTYLLLIIFPLDNKQGHTVFFGQESAQCSLSLI